MYLLHSNVGVSARDKGFCFGRAWGRVKSRMQQSSWGEAGGCVGGGPSTRSDDRNDVDWGGLFGGAPPFLDLILRVFLFLLLLILQVQFERVPAPKI